MNEPLIIAMLDDLKPYNIIVNSHGLLEFNSAKDINEVIDTLVYYTNEFTDSIDKYPDDPVLVAFENAYHFVSLREKIDNKITRLENSEELYEYNNPDDYYIVSDFFRTVLSPNNEVVINNLICIYREKLAVAIMQDDYRLLNILRDSLNDTDDGATVSGASGLTLHQNNCN